MIQHCEGAIIRGDLNKKEIALVFTGDEYADGGDYISGILNKRNIKASFFFTGRFYLNPDNKSLINSLISDGHYLGAHSDQHLLYCDWDNRDSLLVDFKAFRDDILKNLSAMRKFGIEQQDAEYFLPPFEWYNDTISEWCRKIGLNLVNYTPGTISHTDYTTPDMPNYRSSSEIFQNILNYEIKSDNGLNGFILLIHIGSSAERTDKFYYFMEQLLAELTERNYNFCRIDRLLTK